MTGHPRPALNGLPTLLVEDDPAGARLLSGLLADAGCEVRVAASAEDAYIALRSFEPRLVVLDLVLPRMGGLMLARQLTGAARHAGLVIVAVSVMDAEVAGQLALQAGCTAFVGKPIDPLTFADTIAHHVARAGAPGQP